MSLFGGDLPAPPASHDTPSSPPLEAQLQPASHDVPSSPPLEPQLQPAQSIEHDDADDASDELSDSSDRSNKFTGPRSAWYKHTAKERDLADSLDMLRAGDLGIHLYNIHALKQRQPSVEPAAAAKPWDSKAKWRSDRAEKAQALRRKLTAWPLEPGRVPRADEGFSALPKVDPDEKYTVREEGYLQQKPSRDMEDILVGLVLRKAKDNWNGREWEDEDVDEDETVRSRSRKGSQIAGAGALQDTGNPEEEQKTIAAGFARPVIMADDCKAQQILQPTIRSVLSKLDSLLMALHHSRQKRRDDPAHGAEKAGETDATRSEIERPNRKRGQTGSESEPAVKRKRGRPPKVILQGLQDPDPPPETTETEGNVSAPGKRKQGRPRTYPKRLEGETYYMMKKRLKQNQQGANAYATITASETEATAHRSGAESGPAKTASQPPSGSATITHKRLRRRSSTASSTSSGSSDPKKAVPHRASGGHPLRLRDWSEVLGTAAVVGGFNPAIIQRVAKRCANLFGEGMEFRELEERDALGESGEAVEYLPASVPPPDFEEEEEANAEDDGEMAKPYWDGNSRDCPHRDCDRHTLPYDSRWRLREHIKRKHGYQLQTQNERGGKTKGKGKKSRGRSKSQSKGRVMDDEETSEGIETCAEDVVDDARSMAIYTDMVGAVHNDGFMQPIPARQGWRGKDVEQSERRKTNHAGGPKRKRTDV